ncbi:ribosomal protein S6 kinase-related protein-like isoform X2 [Vespula squamosa]|uniref:Ribosomal protein S6 kinase-related protein-like isoform X2 n=1 Tax=Vespula squamosa TaxID=30214 RepID=A0ABD2BEL1_VESSQ
MPVKDDGHPLPHQDHQSCNNESGTLNPSRTTSLSRTLRAAVLGMGAYSNAMFRCEEVEEEEVEEEEEEEGEVGGGGGKRVEQTSRASRGYVVLLKLS